MKRLTLLLVLLMVVAFSATLFAQQLAILKPAKFGQKSEAIPITKKQYQKMMQKSRAMQAPEIKATHAGIIDTLSNPFATSVNWGVASGDSQAGYFDPPAACYIKAIGVVGQAWGTDALSDGYNLIINKAAYGWEFDDSWWDGDAIYTKDKGLPTLLGDLMWGEFPNTVVDGQRVWTEMIWLGQEPDSQGEGFVITVIPYGGSYMGTDAGSDNPDDPSDVYRLAKYYQGGRSGHDPQFTVRHYSVTWKVVVEFYQNTPPSITVTGGPYATVLNSDARTLHTHITDIDANDVNMAGVASANLYYKVNDGDWNTVPMTMVSGTDTDGDWDGVVPAGVLTAGDVLTYKFDATDKAGATSEILGGSYGFFMKYNEILVFYNDDGGSYPSWILSPYYDNLWANDTIPYGYDVWVGLNDGPLSATLVNQYDYIVDIDANSPATLNDDVFGAWFASGTKYMFWSSQEWAGSLWGWSRDSTFAADDWHNAYMGIGHVAHDINYAAAGDQDLAFPINPVAGDIISGGLATFVADSLQLYYNPKFELGFSSWIDQVDPGDGAVTCFTDSAQGRSVGVHKEYNGSKTVFLGFDQLSLDTGALPTYTATDGYHWTEPNVSSVVDNALDWFGAPTDVNDAVQPAVAMKYDMSQNYPNPFNPQTRISYTIAKPGNVKLAVYNVLGQKVATLVDEYKAASTYRVTFDASNLTSGVYFYRLETGDFSKTMKMMLLR
ncbi:MAG: T9SS type A sorting domain-containing protein [Calditrichaeota bacterium]|nr:T9SS type A sorting domain-containing protein [Calditrichota bacterium]